MLRRLSSAVWAQRGLISRGIVKKWVREFMASALLVASLGTLGAAMLDLHGHDYVSSIILVVVGLALLGSGLELFRASMSE